MTKKNYLNILIILLISISMLRAGDCEEGASKVINPTPPYNPVKALLGGVFVKAGTRTTKNGKSWNTAFSDLQEGIDDAFKNKKKKVYVAQGTYNPQSSPTGGSDERYKHFALKNGVEVIGGYPGENVEEFNKLNPDNIINKTILRR